MKQKNITIVNPGAGDGPESEAYDITISPGMNCQQVMEQLGLRGYTLSKGEGKPPISASEELFALVKDGDKLTASTPATVGLGA